MKTKIGHRMVRRTRQSGYHQPGAKDAFIAVAAARWVSYVRSVSPLLAGSRRMPYRRYAVATAVGGTTWSATILLVSYGVGATLGAKVALIVVICVAGLALLVLLIRRLMAHRAVVVDDRPGTS